MKKMNKIKYIFLSAFAALILNSCDSLDIENTTSYDANLVWNDDALATAYVTNMPCTSCAKALIAAGIRRVVVFSDYHDTLAERFFNEAEVELTRLTMPEQIIHYDLDNFSSAKPFANLDDETDSCCTQ